jgi:HAD superfamily hydrolase (TIGR01549 family)
MKGYSLYIFDLDGTLVDSANGLIVCYRRALDKLGFLYDESCLPGFTREPLYATYSRFESPGIDFKMFEEVMFDEYRVSLDPNSFPFPETRYVLQRIADEGLPICIATRSSSKRAKNVLTIHRLIQYIDRVVGYDDVTKQKPDPECLKVCMAHYDIRKDEVLFVGDGETDMMAAEASGVDGALIDRNSLGEDCRCTYRIESLRELF